MIKILECRKTIRYCWLHCLGNVWNNQRIKTNQPINKLGFNECMNFDMSIASFASMGCMGDADLHSVLMTIDDWILISGF